MFSQFCVALNSLKGYLLYEGSFGRFVVLFLLFAFGNLANLRGTPHVINDSLTHQGNFSKFRRFSRLKYAQILSKFYFARKSVYFV